MAREEECFLREEGEVGRAIENRVHVFLLVKFRPVWLRRLCFVSIFFPWDFFHTNRGPHLQIK